ncbi:MAG: recombination protein O N-terminal domain-containing protein [bacterium]|nr:recombination protein O N-terminal domain-containing protein [bacterium]
MSYHVYTTKGIVLSERGVGEADRIYSILTRDLGKLQAKATGVRKGVSKLRGNIEPFSLASISFVKGKDYWRLISAQSLQKISATSAIAAPFSLLEKLIQGEDPHPELFDAVEEKVASLSTDDEMFEIRLVSQILFHLGYLKEVDLTLEKRELIKAINNGLQSSHLT